MKAIKVLMVLTVLSCLLGCLSAAEFDDIPPSGQFWRDAAKVFAPWNSFMSFKQTEQALERLLAGMESIDKAERQPTFELSHQDLIKLLSFNKFDDHKCRFVETEIKAMEEKIWDYENGFGKANLLPYLYVCKKRQASFCSTPEGFDVDLGRPEDIKTRATTNQGRLATIVTEDDGKCTGHWLAKKLNVPPSAETTSRQVGILLSSATFRQALRIIYADDHYHNFHDYFPAALRQALDELSIFEERHGKLQESLQKLKTELAALLNVCTPKPTKCPSVFDEFSKVLAKDKFAELNEILIMKNYEISCLNDMKYYCSYFE